MVLRFVESFDHYGPTGVVNDLLMRKWNRVTPDNSTTYTGIFATGDINIIEGQADGSFAVEITGDSGAASSIMFEWVIPDSTYPNELVVGFWFQHDGAGFSDSVISFRDGSSRQVGVGINGSGILFAERGGSTIDTGTVVLAADTWYYIEVKVLVANSGGSVEVRLNREVELSFSGDTSSSGNDRITAVRFSGIAFTNVRFDDIYICDTTGSTNNDYLADGSNNAGATRIITLYPNGEGNSTNLDVVRAPENWIAVGESAPDDDGTYVEGSSTARDTYTLNDLDVPVSDIYGISNEIIYRKSGPGQKLVSTVIRTGGEDFVSTNENSLMEYVSKTTIHDQNPDTASDWTESDINSLEIGVDVFNPATFLQGTGAITAIGKLQTTGEASLSGSGTVTSDGDVS